MENILMSFQKYARRYITTNMSHQAQKKLYGKLNISTSYFQHIYKKLFGVPVNQDIIKGRIENAARLLHGTDASVSEIAEQCGYENLEHFSRQFKK